MTLQFCVVQSHKISTSLVDSEMVTSGNDGHVHGFEFLSDAAAGGFGESNLLAKMSQYLWFNNQPINQSISHTKITQHG